MAENSKIEWTHHTFNPWIGCSKVSAGCKNCYAEADMDNRRKRVVWGVNGTRSVTAYSYWRQALKWNRDAEAAGERRRVFCASLADIFEDWDGQIVDAKGSGLWWPENDFMYAVFDVQDMPTFAHQTEKRNEDFLPLTLNAIRQQLFKLIERTPHLDWLLLTKRPENVMKMVPEDWQHKFPGNVWIGTSVEDQEAANLRIPFLVKIPAAIKFLSCEPLIGPVDITNKGIKNGYSFPTGHTMIGGIKSGIEWTDPGDKFIGVDLVIVGGESGHNKRPFDVEWGRKLMQHCLDSDVAFFFKQIDKKQPIPEDLLIRQFPN